MVHRRPFSHYFTDNLGYKVLATLITLILWVSVMGRADYVVSRTIKIKINFPGQYVLVSQSVKEVQIKLEGPRNRLLQYSSIREEMPLEFNIEHPIDGALDLPISFDQLEIPSGIKLLSIKPNYLRVEFKRK
jgi:hypothetical protein